MLKASEDHGKKASMDASRLAEELRQEQDHSSQIEKARRVAESMAKELQTRLDEAEAAAMQGGRKIVQKMEQVCRLDLSECLEQNSVISYDSVEFSFTQLNNA